MSFTAWLVLFFFILVSLSLLVYVLVVRAFYWGGNDGPPTKKR
jgi:ABC-type cobalt transport system substrate-binding protein